MNTNSQRYIRFFSTISFYDFFLLTFGLSFLSESLFLFLRQSFLHNLYQPFYLLLFLALIWLYGSLFNQIQAGEKVLQNFSLPAAFNSFIFWLLLSPLFFFRFYHLLLVWRPLPANWLSFLFLYRWKILPIIVLIYWLLLYLLSRNLLVSKFLKQGKSYPQSVWLSWQQTKQNLVKQSLAILFFALSFIVVTLGIKLSFIWFTRFVTGRTGGIILLILYRTVQNCLSMFFFFLLASFNKKTASTGAQNKAAWFRLSLLVIAYIGLYSLHFTQSFDVPQAPKPIRISHRGVSNANGLQNSIEALKRTNHTFHPDLIEMDVQETADHRLVVIHDENLKNLAGKNIRVDETSWSELKQLTLKEHGYSSTVSLFKDYLTAANQLNQRLLIELKVTNKTKSTILQGLLPLEKQLANHQLQSMDLHTANQLKNLFPRLKVGYLLPFDLLGSPKNSLDFVNIEARTASGDLIQAIKQRKQSVYVWSVNSTHQAAIFSFQPWDGLLTDDLTIFAKKTNTIQNQTASILRFD